ncbi:MAG TPA: hypothetical protein VJ881_08555 [Halanaerobiales bacterium]|nr:hypothetical protein [Halanaerobiales bacterium]
MECRVCGVETKDTCLCGDCKRQVDFVSSKMTSSKKKINLQFDEHRFFTRESTAN